jgi:single-strand DNA-binding protein
MSTVNINRVILTGNLTRDPELRPTSSGASVCSLRVASTTQRKSSDHDGYDDKPNYFNVTVWGGQGENAARHLAKGRPVAIDGRLEWRQWEDADGATRNAVDIVADTIQFLGAPNAGPEASDDTQLALHTGQPRPASRRQAPRRSPQRQYARAA